MSDEIPLVANTISSVLSTVIPLFATYRVTLITRGFVDPVYKSKAKWSAILLLSIAISNIIGLLPQPNTTLGAIVGDASFYSFYAIILVAFLFVDRTVLVAERTDFFHRDILGWSRARKPAGVALLATLIVGGVVGAAITSNAPPLWAVVLVDLFVPATVIVLGYGAAALAVSAKRTADMVLKRHIVLLGVSLVMFVVLVASFTLPNLGDGSLNDSVAVAQAVLSIVSLYVLYLSVMSLTKLGKVERLEPVDSRA